MDEKDNKNEGMATAPRRRRQGGAPGEKQKFTADDLVVVIFAFLGFVGSVVLYRIAAPPIIVSFFLSTGVASLVYRFLGGIQGASFVWGALKLGGAMAALVGTAIAVNYYLELQSVISVPVAGRYEWQWAGDSWKGYVDVDQSGGARIEMSRYLNCAGVQKWVPLMKQSSAGKVEALSNQTKLRVKIPVQFINYDANCNRTGLSDVTTLTGDLDRKPAYAGVVEYRTQYGAPVGDMILVKSYSSGVH